MENRDKPDTNTSKESDISKSQAQQQPSSTAGQQSPGGSQFETRTQDPSQQQQQGGASTGQAAGGFQQNDTLTGQRSDVEGSSLGSENQGEGSSFVGSKSDSDASSELVDKDQQFRKDGQGAPDRE
ncbi:hypothetical protein [Sphingomonas xanthus]|uniref:Uncharacterized protein n=1 Tax=Sphingomonas xanthus TaxID=2594473 RepID=A0A516IPU8_9SPHN|nr:hypothetical protein [Sphingomonas xanthus]QDP18943.1 hypothetical protein FMM02_02575 [Sphingomonas xanthus]